MQIFPTQVNYIIDSKKMLRIRTRGHLIDSDSDSDSWLVTTTPGDSDSDSDSDSAPLVTGIQIYILLGLHMQP